MTYQLAFSRKAQKEYDKLPRKVQLRVEGALEVLKQEPFMGKKLEGRLEGQYVVRVWPYRIIYIIERRKVTIIVVTIGHRKDVYDRLRR